jgi:hypothetical protein
MGQIMLELEEKSLKDFKIFLKVGDAFIFYLIKKYFDTVSNKKIILAPQYKDVGLFLIENSLITEDKELENYINLNELDLFILANKNEEIYKNKRSNVFYKPLDLFDIVNKIYNYKKI